MQSNELKRKRNPLLCEPQTNSKYFLKKKKSLYYQVNIKDDNFIDMEIT